MLIQHASEMTGRRIPAFEPAPKAIERKRRYVAGLLALAIIGAAIGALSVIAVGLSFGLHQ